MSNRTELKVVDVTRLPRMDARIVTVEILSGGPSVNMQVISPDAPGRWQIVGFVHTPAEYIRLHPNSMVLSIINLEAESEIREGINLVEVT
jgi:hypothetical protein